MSSSNNRNAQKGGWNTPEGGRNRNSIPSPNQTREIPGNWNTPDGGGNRRGSIPSPSILNQTIEEETQAPERVSSPDSLPNLATQAVATTQGDERNASSQGNVDASTLDTVVNGEENSANAAVLSTIETSVRVEEGVARSETTTECRPEVKESSTIEPNPATVATTTTTTTNTTTTPTNDGDRMRFDPIPPNATPEESGYAELLTLGLEPVAGDTTTTTTTTTNDGEIGSDLESVADDSPTAATDVSLGTSSSPSVLSQLPSLGKSAASVPRPSLSARESIVSNTIKSKSKQGHSPNPNGNKTGEVVEEDRMLEDNRDSTTGGTGGETTNFYGSRGSESAPPFGQGNDISPFGRRKPETSSSGVGATRVVPAFSVHSKTTKQAFLDTDPTEMANKRLPKHLRFGASTEASEVSKGSTVEMIHEDATTTGERDTMAAEKEGGGSVLHLAVTNGDNVESATSSGVDLHGLPLPSSSSLEGAGDSPTAAPDVPLGPSSSSSGLSQLPSFRQNGAASAPRPLVTGPAQTAESSPGREPVDTPETNQFGIPFSPIEIRQVDAESNASGSEGGSPMSWAPTSEEAGTSGPAQTSESSPQAGSTESFRGCNIGFATNLPSSYAASPIEYPSDEGSPQAHPPAPAISRCESTQSRVESSLGPVPEVDRYNDDDDEDETGLYESRRGMDSKTSALAVPSENHGGTGQVDGNNGRSVGSSQSSSSVSLDSGEEEEGGQDNVNIQDNAAPVNENSVSWRMCPEDQEDFEGIRDDANGGKGGDVVEAEFDENGRVKEAEEFQPIAGLAKFSLPSNDLEVFRALCSGIETAVKDRMITWAGTGSGLSALRAMGFPYQERLDALHEAGVDIRDIFLRGREAESDRAANEKACIVLGEEIWNDQAKGAVERLIARLKKALPEHAETLSMDELIAVQPSLHNGMPFLNRHMNFPLHDGFGKVIVTAAVSGSATILLYGPWNEDKNDNDGVWRFQLEEGEVFCLSGLARINCLNAVYSAEHPYRKAIDFRFGLFSKEEVTQITWWDDDEVKSSL